MCFFSLDLSRYNTIHAAAMSIPTTQTRHLNTPIISLSDFASSCGRWHLSQSKGRWHRDALHPVGPSKLLSSSTLTERREATGHPRLGKATALEMTPFLCIHLSRPHLIANRYSSGLLALPDSFSATSISSPTPVPQDHLINGS